MTRRKTNEDVELELESKEPTAEGEALDDAEQLEQEALAEVDSDDNSEASAKADEEEAEAAPKPKRQRRPRKKKAAEPTLLVSEPIPAPIPEVQVAAHGAQPTPAYAAPSFVANPDHLREDAAVAEVSIHKSMDAMARQWASVKDISNSVCANLERVAGSLNDLEAKYATASQELHRQTSQKSQLLNRIAVGASALALVMSLLSLALSQSARQNALNATAQAKVETAPLKSSLASEAPKATAPSVARETRKEIAGPIARSPKVKAERKNSIRK